MQHTVAAPPPATFDRAAARRAKRAGRRATGAPTGWTLSVLVVLVVQAGLLTWGTTGGWFYQDDLTNLAEADGRRFDATYLGLRVNDHLAPVLRAQFWVVANVLPYDHAVTVVWRVALALAATVLMALLLRRLAGTGPVTVLALGTYALSMLTFPSVLNLSSATQLLPAHVALIGCLLMWRSSWVAGRATQGLLAAAAAGLLLGLAVASWEKSALMAPVLVALTAWFPREGGWLRACLRRWVRWLLLAAPTAGFLVAYLFGGAPDSNVTFDAGAIVRATGVAWTDAVAPALVGGPWRWESVDNVYFSIANPPLAGIVAAQVTVLVALVTLVRRRSARALVPLLMPAAYLAASIALVSLGRYEYFGDLIARNYHYVSELAITVAVAVGLAGTTPHRRPTSTRGGRGHRAVALTVVVGTLVGAGLSANAFRERWSQNPTQAYVATLRDDIAQRSLTEPVGLVDVDVPFSVQPFIADERRISALLGPFDLPARYSGDGTTLMPDNQGRLRDAAFLEDAASAEDADVFCSHPLFGEDSLTIDLHGRSTTGSRFVRLEVLQDRTGAVDLLLRDTEGATAAPESGARQVIRAGPRTLNLRVPEGVWTSVEITSRNPAQTLCVVHAAVGTPLAVQP